MVFQTNNLTKIYSGTPVLCMVNMSVHDGDIYGFVGLNGSGKTTLIRIIAGLIRPTSGKYTLLGCESAADMHIARKNIGFIVDSPALIQDFSARGNLESQCLLLGLSKDLIKPMLERVCLEDDNKPVRMFSLGMKQRLALALALIPNPRFLILDEPTNGLDPQGMSDIRNILLSLNKENGTTILMSSHKLHELGQIATRIGIISEGCLIEEMPLSDLTNRLRKHVVFHIGSGAGAIPSAISGWSVKTELIGNQLRVFETAGYMKYANLLMNAGVELTNITQHAQNLEGYFLDRIRSKEARV